MRAMPFSTSAATFVNATAWTIYAVVIVRSVAHLLSLHFSGPGFPFDPAVIAVPSCDVMT